MEEVAGSIPARSTNLSIAYVDGRQANPFLIGYSAEPEQQKGA